MKHSQAEKDRWNLIDTHGFARVAVAIPRVVLGNPPKNVDTHVKLLDKALAQGVQYVLFPELSMAGYSCGDLHFDETILDEVQTAVCKLVEYSRENKSILFSVGLPIVVCGSMYNCAVTIGNGKILAIAPKMYPPTYREFYEGRHFAPGIECLERSVSFCGFEEIPLGSDILICSRENPNLIIHTEVCEDMWVPVSPSSLAALSGATVLANLSASNITIGKAEYREMLIACASGKNQGVQLYSAAGFGESTTDHAWDGDAYIAERGEILAQEKRFEKESTLLVHDVDVRMLVGERVRQTSWHQNARAHAIPVRKVHFDTESRDKVSVKRHTFIRTINPHPFVPSDPSARDKRCKEVFMIQATSLARRLTELPKERQNVLIGVSGGQDSTHALLVGAYAMDYLGLPRTHVHGVTMSGFGTTDQSYENACNLVQAAGATFHEIPIKDFAMQTFAAIGHDPSQYDLTYENVQAWSRKHMLFSLNSRVGGIVVGTGNLSEALVGYCTYGADHFSHYAVNIGVPKTLISYLIRWTSDVMFKDESDVQKVLGNVLSAPISPQLLPPSPSGEVIQRSEDTMGPVELVDFFGDYFVRFGMKPEKIARLCFEAYQGKYSLVEIVFWLSAFLKRFFLNQFKRSCAPDSPKVGLLALSPRGDWRMPSDIRPDIWLEAVKKIPV